VRSAVADAIKEMLNGQDVENRKFALKLALAFIAALGAGAAIGGGIVHMLSR